MNYNKSILDGERFHHDNILDLSLSTMVSYPASFYSDKLSISSWIKKTNENGTILSIPNNLHIAIENNALTAIVEPQYTESLVRLKDSYKIEKITAFDGDGLNSFLQGTVDHIEFDISFDRGHFQQFQPTEINFNIPFRYYSPNRISIYGIGGDLTSTEILNSQVIFKNSNYTHSFVFNTETEVSFSKIKVVINNPGNVIKIQNIAFTGYLGSFKLNYEDLLSIYQDAIKENVDHDNEFTLAAMNAANTAVLTATYVLFDGYSKLSISTPLTDISSISLYFTPNGSSITTTVDVGISTEVYIGEAGTYSAQIINSNGDSKSTGNLVVETILHRDPRVIKTIPNTTATTNEIISSFESLVNYFGDVDVNTLTFSITNPNTSIAQAYITGNSLTIDQRYKLNGIVTFTLTATDPREATASFSFDWTHNQTITTSITNESNTITIAGTTSRTGTINIYSQDETRTSATLLSSGTSDSEYNFSITFTDSREGGTYSYFVSLIDSNSNTIKYIDLGLTTEIKNIKNKFTYDIYYTSGPYTFIPAADTEYTFHILGAAGTPAQNPTYTNYNNKGAYVSFNFMTTSSQEHFMVVGGVSTTLNEGAAGKGGTPWGTANGGFTGGGFSGIFVSSIAPVNAIGVAGGSGAASAGENENYYKTGAPGQGQTVNSSSSMQGGNGENAYRKNNWSAKAGGGGGGGGFTGGSGGNMGGERQAGGGGGGTSYVKSTQNNIIIEAGPTNKQFPSNWELIRTQLGLDVPNNGAIIISYLSNNFEINHKS